MIKLRPIEVFLIQFIFYSLLWFWDDYIASIFSISFAAIALFILLISLMAEFIEPSKVPRWYFSIMIVSIIAPIIVAVLFIYFMGGQLDWLQEF